MPLRFFNSRGSNMRIFFHLLIIQCSLATLSATEYTFRELDPAASHLDFVHPLKENHPQAYLYHSPYAVGGICLGDVNGDGQLDIYLVSGPGENKLFLKNGQTGYAPANTPVLAGATTWGTGANLVDIDNDGDLDLYQCNYDAPNQLFLNGGNGVFTELAGAAGLSVHDASLTASFADVDNDGDLDMFLICNRYYDPKGRPTSPPYEMKSGVPQVLPQFEKHYKLTRKSTGGHSIDEYGRADYFFLNDGNDSEGIPRFRDVSKESGLQRMGYGLSSIWWDFDNDGDLDLYVANDFIGEDRLFRNDGVDARKVPRFTDVIAETFPSISWSSMGSDVADINHDGLPDMMSLDMSATTHFKAKSNMGALDDTRRAVMESGWPRQSMRNHLFINSASGIFQETAYASGVSSSDWSWTCKFGDLDNDGYQDLFISNGMVRNFTDADTTVAMGDSNTARIGHTEWELFKNSPPMSERNLAYQNVDGKTFKLRPEWGLGASTVSYGSVMGDLDNDGDLDLVVSDLGKNVKIYENQGSTNHSFRVKLTGTKSNRMGIGAKVTLTDSAGVKRTRWMNPWTGFQSQNDSTLHFGLGSATAQQVEVFWPSGVYQSTSVKKDAKELSITEKSTGKAPATATKKPRFASAAAPEFTHKEKPYDDFKRQTLLPQKLTQLGPCLAVGDVDGDGDVDFFVGGAQNQEGAVFLNDKGSFTRSKQAVFGGLAKYAEDSAAIWFDADGDMDLDLLVVTGSTEYEPDDILYNDRLYLNDTTDGSVKLTRAPDGAFPLLADSGSCVVAADYDGDGDLDLFIGSRSIPGKYPLTPKSRLIRNDSEDGVVKFTDATPAALKTCGMVTGAQWADLDQDGDPDLALALDWGAVTIFKNDKGNLTDISAAAGSAGFKGWWRSLHAVDVDGDGDLDLVAGNTGINTKYKSPSDKKPAMIYYGDMDGSGKNSIVEAKKGKDVHNRERPLPVRGRF